MIYFDDVTKIYDNGTVGLKDFSLKISDGEFVFVVGPNGSGKSTFINLILRDLKPEKGRIIINNTDIAKLSNRELPYYRRTLGIVFQDYRLLETKTVYENVAFAMEVVRAPQKKIRQQVPLVLQLMGIEDKANDFPRNLSGGQQQRVAIARAIVNNPDILIADEPTGNLDPETSMEIMKLIDQYNKRGRTVIMVTHDREIVNTMQKRVVTIDEGRLVSDVMCGSYEIEAC